MITKDMIESYIKNNSYEIIANTMLILLRGSESDKQAVTDLLEGLEYIRQYSEIKPPDAKPEEELSDDEIKAIVREGRAMLKELESKK